MGPGNPADTETAELAARFDALFPYEDLVAAMADQQYLAELKRQLSALAAPDLVTVMAADEQFHRDRRGVDGFVEAWRDWSTPWATFETEVEDVVVGAGRAVILVRQTGVPEGSSATVESEAAGVLVFDDGKLVRAEFHLDRDEAFKVAGIDP
jgi:ketosteroid isomerase-like protein